MPIVRVLLIVNATASSVTPRRRVRHPAGAAARSTSSRSPRPRAGGTRPASPAAPPHDGVEVVAVLAGDGTLNEAADGLAGTEHRPRRRSPAGPPTSSRAASASRTTRSRPPTQLVGALERGAFRRIGLGVANGRRFLFHPGVGLRRRGDRAGRAALVAQALRRASACSWPRPSTPGCALRPHAARASRSTLDGERSWATLPSRSSRTSARTRTSGTARYCSSPARRPRRPARRSRCSARSRSSLLLRRRRRRCARGRTFARHPKLAAAHRAPRRSTITGDGPFPWQVDGDYLGEVERLDVSLRARLSLTHRRAVTLAHSAARA